MKREKAWAVVRSHPKYGGAVLILNSYQIYRTKQDAERLCMFYKHGKKFVSLIPCTITYRTPLKRVGRKK